MTANIETESRFADVASIFDVMKMYKNNPKNLVLFPWTVPALSEILNPSVRNTRFSVTYDPSQSSTKEIGFEIRVGYATKKMGESSGKYHTLKVKNTLGSFSARSGANIGMGSEWSELAKNLSPYGVAEKTIGISTVHPRREHKLKEMFDAVELTSEATGMTVHFTGVIKGSRPRTWSSALSVLGGSQNEAYGSMKQIWDIRLERPSGSPNAPKHLCVKGKLKLPILHILSIEELRLKPIDFVFENKISMGASSCNEATITTTGLAKVSEQQKEFSQKSLESMKCAGMLQRGNLAASSSRACIAAYLQARAVDTIEITNQFNRVPEVVKTWEQRLVTIVKAYLWPFTSSIQSENHRVSGSTFTTSFKMEFQKWARAFELSIKRPTEELAFTNIRIPYPFALFVPLKAGVDNLRLHSDFDSCSITQNSVRTFDRKLLPIGSETDGCYHLLTADSEKHTFAIEYKKNPATQKYNIKMLIGDNVIIMRWASNGPIASLQYSNGTTEIIDFPRSQVLPGHKFVVYPIEDVRMEYNPVYLGTNGRHMRYILGVRIKDTIDIYSEGTEILLQVNQFYKFYKNKLAGICGAGVCKSAKSSGHHSCKYTKSILEVASNRIQTASCPQLKQSIKEELEKEKAKCLTSQLSSIQV
jgi:hypothetical protein